MLDISVILNVHNEARFIARTIRSLSEAAEFAHFEGIRTELIVVLDCADERTRQAVQRTRATGFHKVQVIECENRSLGLSRNTGCDVANGEYLCPQDADDLVSFNYFVEIFALAKRRGRETILFPEWLVGFGASTWISRHENAARAQFLMADQHAFNSRAFFHRSVYEKQKYEHPDHTRGHAYEDYLFNSTAIANGFELDYCPEIVLYYRQRPNSIMASARRSGRLEVPHNPLFSPKKYMARFGKEYAQVRSGAWPDPAQYNVSSAYCANSALAVLTVAANRIDPIVNPALLPGSSGWSPSWASCEAAAVYYEMCAEVGDRTFTDVFVLPYLLPGGAERYILDVMRGLLNTGIGRNALVITGEYAQAHTWRHKLPSHVTFVDVHSLGARLTDEQRERLTARLIMSVAPDARIHVKTSLFGHRLIKYHHPHFRKNKIIYYRFCDDMHFEAGTLATSSFGTEFICDHLDEFTKIVSDNAATVADDVNRFDLHREKWVCLPAFIEPGERKARPSGSPKKRVLWASRIGQQKRVSLLPHLALELSKKMPDVTLDVYGTFDQGFHLDMSKFNYRGAFSNIADIALDQYDAFIYTSWYDGLPNIILEAMAAGLPVIAPGIGGIADAITDGDTGILLDLPLDDAQAASQYVQALGLLYDDPTKLAYLSANALNYISGRHGRAGYLAGINRIFGDTNYEKAA